MRRVVARRAKRGRPRADSERSLSREMILDASVKLIDEVGLEKFTIRELAQRIGVYPTAIYWHLPTRNALLAATVNQILGEITAPALDVDWKSWLSSLFRETRQAVRRHPNIAPLIASQMLSNAGADLMLVDRILAVLESAGFAGATLLAAYDVVIATGLGFVAMEFAAPPTEDTAGWRRVMRQTIEGLDGSKYPHIDRHKAALTNRHFILRWENGDAVPLDASFEAYTYVVIEGLRQLLTR